VVRSLILFALLTAAGFVLIESGSLDMMTDQQELAHYVASHGWQGWLILVCVGALYTGLGAPRQLLALAYGFVLGPVWGTLLSTGVALAGAVGCFLAGRYLIRPYLVTRFEARMTKFDRSLEQQPFLKILLIRLLPVGSNLLTNLIAGASRIRIMPFVAGSAVGYIPQMLIFALAGSGISQARSLNLALSLLLFVVVSLVGVWLYRNRKNRSLAV
jgi:uncharacterized membrane protein YdjX (TVP38/TMEM64 family)